MGFTRYHDFDVKSEAFQSMWPTLVVDARAIMRAVEARGVRLRGAYGTGVPIVSSTAQIIDTSKFGDVFGVVTFSRGVIWLNGDAERDEDLEGFVLAPEADREYGSTWFTKTGCQPYDLAVSAILPRAAALAPDTVDLGADVHSDDPEDPWSFGRALLRDLGIAAGPAGRPSRE